MLFEHIKTKLAAELDAVHVDIVDNSWMHAGHAGATPGNSHLAALVVSPRFEGLSILDQHRLVQQTLKEEMSTAIHALELKTLTPQAWEQKKAAKA